MYERSKLCLNLKRTKNNEEKEKEKDFCIIEMFRRKEGRKEGRNGK